MSRSTLNTASSALAIAVIVLATSCGGNDDDAESADSTALPAATDEASTATENTDATAATSPETSTSSGQGGDVAPPAESSGVVTVDGVDVTLTPDDLLLCETVNPAFDESINIQARFDVPPGEFVVLGVPIASRMAISVLGDLPDDVAVDAGDADTLTHPADEVVVERDGRTVTGSAVIVDERVGASVTDEFPLSDTDLQFMFTC